MADQTLAELFVEIKASNAQLLNALKGAETQTKSSATKMQSFLSAINFKSFITGTFGIYAAQRAIRSMVGSMARFERSMAAFNTIANVTNEELADMSKEARNAAAAVGESPGGFADAMYQAVSAGVEVNKAIELTTQAALLAKSGFTTTREAVDLLTTAMNAYGDAIDSAQHASDVLLETQNLGKTTINELAGTMGRLIPVAAQLGVDFEVLAGAVATMTAQGVNTFETVTALRSLLVALSAPSEAQAKVWNELGIQWKEGMLQGDGLVTVLNDLASSTEGSISKLTELGINQRALIGALSLGGEAADKFRENNVKLGDSAGATAEAAKQMDDTVTESSKKAGASFVNLTTSIGNLVGILPALKAGMQVSADAFNFLADVVDNMEIQQQIATPFGNISVAAEAAKKSVDDLSRGMTAFPATLPQGKGFPMTSGAPVGEVPTFGKDEIPDIVGRRTEFNRLKSMWKEENQQAQYRKNAVEARREAAREAESAAQRQMQMEQELTDSVAMLNAEAIDNATERAIAIENIRFEQRKRDLADIEDNHRAIELAEEEHRLKLIEISDAASARMTAGIQNFAVRYANIMADIVVRSKFSFDAIKQSFSAMLASMAAQFAAQAAVFSIFGTLFPGLGVSVGGAGGFGGILKNVLGFPSRAGGGLVSAGGVYNVNDANRPEMFVPSQPGIIAPDMGNGILKALGKLSAGTTDQSQTSINFNGNGSDMVGVGRVALAGMIRDMWRSGELSYMTS